MATTTDPRSKLTEAYRQAQGARATAVALIVAYYYSQIDPEDPQAVEAWLTVVLPRILREHDNIAQLGATFGNKVRQLEVGNDDFRFTPSVGAVIEQVRKSLQVVGPFDYHNKLTTIGGLDVSPTMRKALISEAKDVTKAKVAASAYRHAANGGRQTLIDGATEDKVALGYVRVTKAKPCYFCAMLASRGVVYSDDSFDHSDARFIGPGDVKVHDSCACTMKPVYSRDDPLLEDTAKFQEMWQTWGAGGGDALNRFRTGYNQWLKTGVITDLA